MVYTTPRSISHGSIKEYRERGYTKKIPKNPGSKFKTMVIFSLNKVYRFVCTARYTPWSKSKESKGEYIQI
jgi:predicted Zn-dependent protease